MRGEPLLMIVLSATVVGAAEGRGTCPALSGADLACLVTDAEGILRPNSKAVREDPTCNTEWAREHLGIPAAERILDALASAARLDNPGKPGAGSTIAQMDTGYRAHPELGPTDDSGAILLHDPYADPDAAEIVRRLPLNYVEGCPPDLKYGCAPRVERAKHSTVRGDTQLALGDPLPRFTTPILGPLLNAAPLRQPGHGTGTASVMIAPGPDPEHKAMVVKGLAPGARLVPYRVTNGSILEESRTVQMANGIASAALLDRPRVDVMNISFGRRSPDDALERAVRLAERRGIIVVAATGEMPFPGNGGPVRFPAQYASVIAVTGTKVDAAPWGGTADILDLGFSPGTGGAGKGRETAIAAPAVKVWRASWTSVDGEECPTVGRGEGTSFSAPLVSAAAALWIQRHGREKLDVTYGRAAVPEAFRYALTHHGYRTPHEMCELAKGMANDTVAQNILKSQDWSDEDILWLAEAHPADKPWLNAESVCHDLLGKEEAFRTGRLGAGILAVDKLLARNQLPEPEAVCQSIYDHRGPEDWDALCPEGSPGRGDPAEVLKFPPLYHPILGGGALQPDEADRQKERLKKKTGQTFPPQPLSVQRITWLAGASAGRPFGSGAGVGPALSLGLLFGEHERRAPKGPTVQLKWSGTNVIFGLGYAAGVEYNPFRNTLGKHKNSIIWGFGPSVGFGIKAAYMRAADLNYVGIEAEIVLFKIKLMVGRFRPTSGDFPGRWTWDLGTGF
jgi:subtilisin family serine protease